MKIVLQNVSPRIIDGMLNTILDNLRYDRSLPILYGSHIRYRNDPGEVWQDPHQTARVGYGDCEDLALYRALELRGHGQQARVRVYAATPQTMHVVVDRCDGRFEDPSRMLGMNGRIGEDASHGLNLLAPPEQQVMPIDFKMAAKAMRDPEGAANDMAMQAAMAAASSVVPGGGLVVQLMSSPEGRELLKQLKASKTVRKLKFW